MSDAMDSDAREVIRRRIALRERDGHERLLLNHIDLRALLDAADERDRLAAWARHARALHAAEEGHYGAYCPVDGYVYPCPTISALDGLEVLDAVIACGHTRYGLDCALPDGHEGLHRGTQTVTWTDDGSDR